MKTISLPLIGNAFIFAITKPFAHIGKLLLALLANWAAYVVVFLCFLLPALGIMSAVSFYVIGYKTNIIANSMLNAVMLASFFAMIWRFTGLVRFYGLMHDDKPLLTNVFFFPVRLFAKAYLLLPFTLPLWFIVSPPQPASTVIAQKLFNMFSASFIPMLLIAILGGFVILYWAIVGQFALLEMTEGGQIKDAIRKGFHLTHRNLLTVFLYEVGIFIIAGTLFFLVAKFSQLPAVSYLEAFALLMAISIASNYFVLVIFPASLVYLYKRLKETNLGSA